MKKLVTILCVAIMLAVSAFSFVGCGSDGETSGKNSTISETYEEYIESLKLSYMPTFVVMIEKDENATQFNEAKSHPSLFQELLVNEVVTLNKSLADDNKAETAAQLIDTTKYVLYLQLTENELYKLATLINFSSYRNYNAVTYINEFTQTSYVLTYTLTLTHIDKTKQEMSYTNYNIMQNTINAIIENSVDTTISNIKVYISGITLYSINLPLLKV